MSLAEVLVSTAVLSIAGTGSLQLTANLGHTLVSQRQLDGVMQQLDQAVQASHERMAQEGASASCADPAALLELLAARAAAATPSRWCSHPWATRARGCVCAGSPRRRRPRRWTRRCGRRRAASSC